MEKIINIDNIRNFAYINDRVCKKPIAGIVLDFFGLGNTSVYRSDTVKGEFYGEHSLLYVVPYYNPWCWMNAQTVAFVDELVSVLSDAFGLSELPVISAGESMGGQAALVYCAYSARTPAACAVNCPVCDVPFHYTERDDLPRTMYSALSGYNGTLDEALRSISPLHLTDRMPNIPYKIFHCLDDKAVDVARHSDAFVAAMKKAGRDVTYHTVPACGHCDIGYEMKKLFAKYVLAAANVEY